VSSDANTKQNFNYCVGSALYNKATKLLAPLKKKMVVIILNLNLSLKSIISPIVFKGKEIIEFLWPSKYEFFTAMTIQVVVFWVMMWEYIDVSEEFATSMVLWNVGILPQHYTASQPSRPRLEPSSPWKPRLSHLLRSLVMSPPASSHRLFHSFCRPWWAHQQAFAT
jgi:hypothetical protein